MNNCKPIGAPLQDNCNPSKTTVLRRGLRSNLEREKLTSDVDRLFNYLALSSRPDICFAAYALNSSVKNTKEIFGKAAERVPRC